jgi:hypothetical protein
MIKDYSVFIGLIIVVVMFLTGCTYRDANMEAWKGDNRLKEDYGNSQRLAIANQTLNPEAGKDLKPVYGFNGRAAENVMEKQYIKGFETPCTTTGGSVLTGGIVP